MFIKKYLLYDEISHALPEVINSFNYEFTKIHFQHKSQVKQTTNCSYYLIAYCNEMTGTFMKVYRFNSNLL